jgi:hypothetical protein
MLDKKFITISNTDVGGSASNFYINLNNNTVTNEVSGFNYIKKYIRPISLSVDLSYFNISSALGNNAFKVEGVALTPNSTTITLDDGSYNGITLGEQILLKLNAAAISWTGGSPLVWTGTAFDGIGITFKQVTAKPGATSNANALIKFVFKYNSTDSKKILGFITDTADLVYTVGVLKSPVACDLVIYNSLYIRSNIAKSFYKMNNNILSNTNILMIVNIGSEIGGTQLWESGNDEYYQEIIDNWSNLQFIITDKNGNIIPFNDNSEFIFTFCIETEKVEQTIEQKVKSQIDYIGFK